MISLQLKSGEYVTIGDDIAVQVFEQSGSYFRLSIKAPREIPILRGEVHERTAQRPDGLHSRRPKSPSERRYDARHLEESIKKKEARAEKEAALAKALLEVADGLDSLAEKYAQPELRDEVSSLRARLLPFTDM